MRSCLTVHQHGTIICGDFNADADTQPEMIWIVNAALYFPQLFMVPPYLITLENRSGCCCGVEHSDMKFENLFAQVVPSFHLDNRAS